MFSSTIGSLVGYMMLSTDFLMTLSHNVGYGLAHAWRPVVVCTLAFGIMLPLSLLRTLASLAYVAPLANVPRPACHSLFAQ